MPRSDSFFPALLRRLPFTFALAFTIFTTALVTGTLVRSIDAGQLAAWGFGAADLAGGRWYQVALAAFQIVDPYLAVSMLATVLALVGACEYRLGTARTVVIFVVTHVAGSLAVVTVAKALAARANPWGISVVGGREVGASAGAVGALAAWLTWFPGRLRRPGILVCAGFLMVAFLGQVHPWDVAHAAAFATGFLLGTVMQRTELPETPAVDGVDENRRKRRLALAWILSIVGLTAILAPFTICELLPLSGPAMPYGTVRQNVLRWIFLLAGAAAWWAVGGVRRGERRAWWIAAGAGAVASVGLWQPGAPGVEHILALLLVAGLLAWRRDFRQASQPASVGRGISLLGGALVFVVLGFVALRMHFVPPLEPAQSLHFALSRLALGPVWIEGRWDSPGARWFLTAIPVVVYGGALLSLSVIAHGKFVRKRTSFASPAGDVAKSE